MGQRQEKIMGPKLHKQKALQTFSNLQSKLAISLLEFFVLTQKDWSVSIPEPPLHCHRLVGSVLNKGLDAETNVKRSNWYDSVVAGFLVAPSFPCHHGFCNWTNKLTRFPLFWGLVYDLSNKLALARVSIAANTELFASQATGPSCTLSTQPHGNGLLGSSWFWCYFSSPGCKVQPRCPPWGLPPSGKWRAGACWSFSGHPKAAWHHQLQLVQLLLTGRKGAKSSL